MKPMKMKPDEPLSENDLVAMTYDQDTCGVVIRLGPEVSVVRINGTREERNVRNEHLRRTR